MYVYVPNDTPRYNPGPHRFTITNAVGTSNPGYFNFLGNQNILAPGSSQFFTLDQAFLIPDPFIGGSNVNGAYHIFDSTLNLAASFPLGGLTTGIATTNVNGNPKVLVVEGSVVAICDPTNLTSMCGGIADNANDLFMAIAAKNGFGCVTAELANSLSCFDLSQPLPMMITISIGMTPMNVAMGTVNGQLTAAVLNIGEGTLAWVSLNTVNGQLAISTPQFVSLSGFTKIAQLYSSDTAIFADGWQLVMFDSGTAAVLSRGNRADWFANLATSAVSGPYTIPADPFGEVASGAQTLFNDPFRIAVDNWITAANPQGALIVALADANGLSGGTRFVKVDVATGTVTPLQSTSSLLDVGLAVTSDGTQIIGCMRDACEAKPNN